MTEESTTPDLEELIRRVNEAFNRRDFDAALATFTPDAVWDFSSIGMGIFVGRKAIRGLWEDWFGSFEDWEQALEEFHDLGNGLALAVYLQRGRPAGSSGFVENHYGAVGVTGGDGLTERITFYNDLDEARAVAERLAQERGKAVSDTKLDLILAATDALNAGDLDALMELWAPDIEVDLSRALGPMQGVYCGEEAQRLLIDFRESWQSERIEPHEFIEDREHVVVPSTTHFVGRDGIGVQARVTWTFTIRDGMIVRACFYQDKQEALEAVGLAD